jgi:enoyl-CoA hydratase/carnithine racemase
LNSSADILFERRGTAGIVILSRPQALNAVTHAMVRALTEQLAAWADDAAVTRVIVLAAGTRAFSAGGDLKAIYELGRSERYDDALAFWWDEYRLNALIKQYRKPYVALIDGVVMGGGAGISINGSHRVAGDAFRFAMPEVGIGFFPDVGATWFLPRLPGELGTYCALTGDRLDAADGLGCGIATHRVRSARFGELIEALCGAVPVDTVLAAFTEPMDAGALMRQGPAIERWFNANHVEAILAGLEASAAGLGAEADFARTAAAAIRTKSPLSLKLALTLQRRGRTLAFDECIRTEYRVVSRVARGHDFYEGIRAVIIDKDQAPTWRPSALAAISDAEVERHFAPLDRELDLPELGLP